MKKPLRSLTTKSIVTLSIALVMALLVTATGVYAAYTNSRHAQRTIAAYDATGDRFSSNDLGRSAARYNQKTMYTADPSHDPSTVVTVCNYERGKQTRPSDQAITYTLSARLVKYDALDAALYVPVDAAYMTANSLGGYTVTIRKGATAITLGGAALSGSFAAATLPGGEAQADAYTVTFDADFAVDQPNLYLELTATPTNDALPTLSGIFRADMRLEGATNDWTGAFHDDTAYAPAQYDGFNYRIEGVGNGTCTLRWDDTKVALSYVSLAQLTAITGAVATANSVTFAVNSDEVGLYDLQFYKVNITTETWTTMNNTVVQLDFHA